MTPLMYAAREGRLTVVNSLITVTSDINCQDNKGYTVCRVFCTMNDFLRFILKTLPLNRN